MTRLLIEGSADRSLPWGSAILFIAASSEGWPPQSGRFRRGVVKMPLPLGSIGLAS